jgi:hypothetical protein
MIAFYDFCISLGFIFECDYGSLGGITFCMEGFPHFHGVMSVCIRTDRNTRSEAHIDT